MITNIINLSSSRCGCATRITGNWPDNHFGEGVVTGSETRKRPDISTITGFETINVCKEHQDKGTGEELYRYLLRYRTQVWSIPTCTGGECRIEHLFENDIDIGVTEIFSKCTAHSEVPDEDLFSVGVSECRRIGDIRRALHSNSDIYELTTNDAGDQYYAEKEGVVLDFKYKGSGANRELELKVVNVQSVEVLQDQLSLFENLTIQ